MRRVTLFTKSRFFPQNRDANVDAERKKGNFAGRLQGRDASALLGRPRRLVIWRRSSRLGELWDGSIIGAAAAERPNSCATVTSCSHVHIPKSLKQL